MEDRRKEIHFKRVAGPEASRRRRENQVVQIRKGKREERLVKIRSLVPGTLVSSTLSPGDIPELVIALLASLELETTLSSVRQLRQLLSFEEDPPVDQVVDAPGLLPRLIELLRCDASTELQVEVAWALTNVASTDRAGELVEAGACPELVRLLGQEHAVEVREQAAWCLGNIAGDQPE